MKWYAYCFGCDCMINHEFNGSENGELVECLAKRHSEETGHTTMVGTLNQPKKCCRYCGAELEQSQAEAGFIICDDCFEI